MPRSYDKIIDDVVDNILDLRNKKKIKDVIWKAFEENKVKCFKNCGKDMRILILNAPCHGFGDLIFAMKLATYLRNWYGAKVTIATTFADGLVKLGERKENIVKLSGGKETQCRRFKLLKISKKLPKQDLIFLAPVQADFDPNLGDVRSLIPYANKLNTFTFSEYNDSTRKGFDFNTGVGKDRDGLLLTKVPNINAKSGKIKGPYAIAYIAHPDSIPNAESCLIGFLELIARKYNRKGMQVIIPTWLEDEYEGLVDRILKKIEPNFTTLTLITKNREKITIGEGSKEFILRGDIFPVSNREMLRLIKHSVKDILLTGDQSITDALSCCPHKNIFYQIAPWKEGFGQQLAKEMPNRYLKRKRTSCGTVKAVNYTSDYRGFIKKWDFRKLARPKLDAIMASIKGIKENSDLHDLADMILESRTLQALKDKVREWDEDEKEE